MQTFLIIFEVVVSILLSISILVQEKGVGLSATFGGGDSGEVYTSRRGADRFLHRATVTLSLLFFGGAIAFFFV